MQVRTLAERYFGGWSTPGQKAPQPVVAVSHEPSAAPAGPRFFEAPSKAGPGLMQAYYRPGTNTEEAITLEVVRWLLHSNCRALLPWCGFFGVDAPRPGWYEAF